MIKTNKKLLDKVSGEAKKSKRRRMNYNFHKDYSDTLQRMLNALEPGTYIQPHKHEDPDKTEAFILLKGRIAVLEFDEKGNIVDYIILDHKTNDVVAEIPPRTFHSIIALEEGSVAYELKDGPYVKIEDKNFASWAPKEGDAEVEEYLQKLIDFVKN